ncbi:MAG TPA: chemotaxis protein CheW [Allocoleopsis sp.]
MNQIQSFDLQQVQTLTEQGDLNSIATWLNYHLNPQGITVRVGWKNDCLGILLESSPFPDRVEIMTFMRQHLAHFKLDFLKRIKVCGYQPGLSVPAWYEEIELEGELEPSVGYMSLEYMVPSLNSWLNQGLEAALSEPETSPVGETAIEHRRFLRFYITATETALLPLNSIQEIIKIPVPEILSVPHMPDCIAGIYNWRGEMLWLVDAAQQLGFASPLMQDQNWETMTAPLTAIVLKPEHQSIGFLVARLLDVESHSLQQIHPPTAGIFPAKFLPFMQGYLVSSTSPILNANALIHDPLLQVHCPR